MKKYLGWIIMILSAAVFTGCAKQPAPEASPTVQPEELESGSVPVTVSIKADGNKCTYSVR